MVTGGWRTTPPSAGECEYYTPATPVGGTYSINFNISSHVYCYFLVLTSQTEAEAGEFKGKKLRHTV